MKNPKSPPSPRLRRASKKSKAFTLVEILTVVFLGTVIIMAGYSVYQMSYQSYQKNSKNAELTQNARIALERMSREIRQSLEILPPPLPENPGAGTPPSTITFQDGHVIVPTQPPLPTNCEIQYVTYYLSGNELHRKITFYTLTGYDECVLWSAENAQEQVYRDQIKAEKISSLQFWGINTITIHLTASDNSSSFQFETKVYPRNI